MSIVGTIEKTETCEKCGKVLKHETVQIGSTEHDLVIECECFGVERKKQRDEEIKLGTANCRVAMQIGTGLKARHRSMTFDSFTPRNGQKDAFDACKAYAEQGGKENGKGVIINGPVGSGKSHLAAAICNDIISNKQVDDYYAIQYASKDPKNPDFPSVYSGLGFISSVGLLNKLRATYSTNEDEDEVMNEFKRIRLLVIDDLGAEKPTDWAAEKLFEIVDYRYNEYLPIIVTTNLTVQEMREALGDRITDRLRSMCKLVNITAPSQRVTAE